MNTIWQVILCPPLGSETFLGATWRHKHIVSYFTPLMMILHRHVLQHCNILEIRLYKFDVFFSLLSSSDAKPACRHKTHLHTHFSIKMKNWDNFKVKKHSYWEYGAIHIYTGLGPKVSLGICYRQQKKIIEISGQLTVDLIDKCIAINPKEHMIERIKITSIEQRKYKGIWHKKRKKHVQIRQIKTKVCINILPDMKIYGNKYAYTNRGKAMENWLIF